jgi:hypothetical protein
MLFEKLQYYDCMTEYLCHIKDNVPQQGDMVEKFRGCDCTSSLWFEYEKNGACGSVVG